MSLAIISSDDLFIRVAQEALKRIGHDAQLYASWEKCSDTQGIMISDQNLEKRHSKATYFIFDKKYTKLARFGAVLDKIQNILKNNDQKTALKAFKIGVFELNPQYSTILNKKTGFKTKLTTKEQDILLFLFENRHTAVSKQDLLDQVWGYGEGIETHTLETHIYRLRQKIEGDPANPTFLTVSDDGYLLNL